MTALTAVLCLTACTFEVIAEASAPVDAAPTDAAQPDAAQPDADPRDADPRDADPRDADPRDADPRDADPDDADPDDVDGGPDANDTDDGGTPDADGLEPDDSVADLGVDAAPDAGPQCMPDELACDLDCPPLALVPTCSQGCCPRLPLDSATRIEPDGPHALALARVAAPTLLTVRTLPADPADCVPGRDTLEIFTVDDGRARLVGAATHALGARSTCLATRALLDPDRQYWIRLPEARAQPLTLSPERTEPPPVRDALPPLVTSVTARPSLGVGESATSVIEGPAYVRGQARSVGADGQIRCMSTRFSIPGASPDPLGPDDGCGRFEAVVQAGEHVIVEQTDAPEGVLAHEWVVQVTPLVWPEGGTIEVPDGIGAARQSYPPMPAFEQRNLTVESETVSVALIRIGELGRCDQNRLTISTNGLPDDARETRTVSTGDGCWQGLLSVGSRPVLRVHGDRFAAVPESIEVVAQDAARLPWLSPIDEVVRLSRPSSGVTLRLRLGGAAETGWRLRADGECVQDIRMQLLSRSGAVLAVDAPDPDVPGCVRIRAPERLRPDDQLVLYREDGGELPDVELIRIAPPVEDPVP